MKISHQTPLENARRGITLVELSIVMLVLFSLVFLFFVSAKAWIQGSNRSTAILTMRSAQIGVRSHLQIEGKIEEESIPDLPLAIFGLDKFVYNGMNSSTGEPKADGEFPEHPVTGLSYGFVAENGDIVPPRGELYICTGGGNNLNDLTYNPQQSIYSGW